MFSPIGSVRSLGYNVQAFSDPSVLPDTSCRLDAPTDRVAHPWVSTLGDHGGPTPTKVPRSGSPLIDAIPATEPACAGTDQRGIARPERGSCDIGAVEVRTPVARDLAVTVVAGGEAAIDLLGAVDDPDGVLSQYELGAPAHGTLHPQPTSAAAAPCAFPPDDIEDIGPIPAICSFSVQPPANAPLKGYVHPRQLSVIGYSPDAGFAGTDSVSYVLCSAGSPVVWLPNPTNAVVCTQTQTISITVTPLPVVVEPRFTG